MIARPLTWRAVEHRVTRPFPTSDPSLENVGLRLSMSEDPTDRANNVTRYLEGEQDWDGLTPELFFDIDTARLTADTGVQADDIVVSVICRDRRLCKFETVNSWPMREVPEDVWSLNEVLHRFSRSTLFDLVVVATPRSDIVNQWGIAIPTGASLASVRQKTRNRLILRVAFRISSGEER